MSTLPVLPPPTASRLLQVSSLLAAGNTGREGLRVRIAASVKKRGAEGGVGGVGNGFQEHV